MNEQRRVPQVGDRFRTDEYDEREVVPTPEWMGNGHIKTKGDFGGGLFVSVADFYDCYGDEIEWLNVTDPKPEKPAIYPGQRRRWKGTNDAFTVQPNPCWGVKYDDGDVDAHHESEMLEHSEPLPDPVVFDADRPFLADGTVLQMVPADAEILVVNGKRYVLEAQS